MSLYVLLNNYFKNNVVSFKLILIFGKLLYGVTIYIQYDAHKTPPTQLCQQYLPLFECGTHLKFKTHRVHKIFKINTIKNT